MQLYSLFAYSHSETGGDTKRWHRRWHKVKFAEQSALFSIYCAVFRGELVARLKVNHFLPQHINPRRSHCPPWGIIYLEHRFIANPSICSLSSHTMWAILVSLLLRYQHLTDDHCLLTVPCLVICSLRSYWDIWTAAHPALHTYSLLIPAYISPILFTTPYTAFVQVHIVGKSVNT